MFKEKGGRMLLLARLFFCLFLVACFATATDAKDLCLGTFSSFHVNHESGDLLGVEIKIVLTHAGKQAVIQFSEGEPGPLVITPIVCDGAHLSFILPSVSGREATTFNGSIFKDQITGDFFFKNGGREKVVLIRRKSYWD